MNITKNELVLKSRYWWPDGHSDFSKAHFFGDNLVFGRHDGMQVLCLINKLMEQYGIDFRLPLKIEEMLIFLPEKQLNHLQVKLWLVRNWSEEMILS